MRRGARCWPRRLPGRTPEAEEHATVVERIRGEEEARGGVVDREQARRMAGHVQDRQAAAAKVDHRAVRDQRGRRRGPDRVVGHREAGRRGPEKGRLGQPTPPHRALWRGIGHQVRLEGVGAPVGQLPGAADVVVMTVREQADHGAWGEPLDQRAQRCDADARVDEEVALATGHEPNIGRMQRAEPRLADAGHAIGQGFGREPAGCVRVRYAVSSLTRPRE